MIVDPVFKYDGAQIRIMLTRCKCSSQRHADYSILTPGRAPYSTTNPKISMCWLPVQRNWAAYFIINNCLHRLPEDEEQGIELAILFQHGMAKSTKKYGQIFRARWHKYSHLLQYCMSPLRTVNTPRLTSSLNNSCILTVNVLNHRNISLRDWRLCAEFFNRLVVGTLLQSTTPSR
jgi:hypothetical protein